jgi:hypothetical protein
MSSSGRPWSRACAALTLIGPACLVGPVVVGCAEPAPPVVATKKSDLGPEKIVEAPKKLPKGVKRVPNVTTDPQ